MVFNDPWRSLKSGVCGFVKLVEDYKSYAIDVFKPVRRDSGVTSRPGWCAPARGRVKVNVDATLFPGGGVGLGIVIRSDGGQILAVGVRKLMANWDTRLGEAMAARFGLCMAAGLNYKAVKLEGDALEVIKAIQTKQFGRTPTGLILEDTSVISMQFDDFTISHVCRAGNSAAHLAARLMPSNGEEQIFVSSFPQGIKALADLDLIP